MRKTTKKRQWLFSLICLSCTINQTAHGMGMGGGMGGMGGGGMGGGTSSTTIIDPPKGAAFKDPVTMKNLSKQAGMVKINLEAKVAPIIINGVTANLKTYNGHYPAPTINVKKGDVLNVHFKNSLPYQGVNLHGHDTDLTNLHTHGFHVSPDGNSDNTMLSFQTGNQFDYSYDLKNHPAGNLNWYHAHRHGTTAEQLWAGMAGAIIVADDNTNLASYKTHTLVLKDISLNGSAPESHNSNDFMMGKEGNTMMINGQVNPVLTMKPNEIQRWRILNASNARFYKLNLANHNFQIIGTDGGLLDKPHSLTNILMAPGERVDVLIQASATAGDYKLIDLPYSRGGMMMMGSSLASANQKITMLTLTVAGKALKVKPLPSVINNNAVRLSTPNNTPTRQITLSMGMGMMGGSMMSINGISFSDTSAFTLNSSQNSYEVWQINNMSMMDHPFHQHVNSAQVLSISGGDSEYQSFYTSVPALKDTVIVPAMGSIQLLVPIKDYGGTAMFHCHILEHEDMGMMGLWSIQ